jgi:hypothetical protein
MRALESGENGKKTAGPDRSEAQWRDLRFLFAVTQKDGKPPRSAVAVPTLEPLLFAGSAVNGRLNFLKACRHQEGSGRNCSL